MWRYFVLLAVLIPRTIYSYFVILLFNRDDPYSERINSMMRKWCRMILEVSGVKVQVKGEENIIHDSSFVLMSNHQSAFDIPVLGAMIPATVRYMSKKENFKIPFLGGAMKRAGIVSIDRQRRSSAFSSIKEAIKILQNNKFGVIGFPEGTRTLDGEVKRFKKGLFMMAIDGRLPIIPVSISGAFAILKKESFHIKPGIIKLTIHPAIDIKKYSHDNRDELVNDVKKIIESAVDAKMGVSNESH